MDRSQKVSQVRVGHFDAAAERILAMDKSQKASLGCGSLILIALIVLIFGHPDQEELRQEIKTLDADVHSLRSSIQSQSDQIMELKKAIEASRPKAGDEPRAR